MAVFTAFFLSLVLLFTIPGCFGGEESPNSTAPGDDENQNDDPIGSVIENTDEAGLVEIRNASDEVVFEAEVLDSLGNPLPDVEVCYFLSSPNDLACFLDAETGSPMGMFELVTEETYGRGKTAQSKSEDVNSGVFILSLLDPSLGRLYDPGRDGFAPTRSTTLQSIRRVMDYEDLTTIIEMTNEVMETRVMTKAEIVGSLANSTSRLFSLYEHEPSQGPDFIILQRVTRLISFVENQHDSYRYRLYRIANATGLIGYFIPLGVQAAVTITNPVDGTTYTDADDRLQMVTGTINRPPDILTSDGGHVDLYGNGVLIGQAISVGGDGSGEGAEFSSEGDVQLAEGENTLQVIAYVSEVNQGFENGIDGEAGKATITVNYEPEEADPTAPALSSFSHPTQFGGPDGQFSVSFNYADPDGDIALVWEHLTYYMLGQGGDITASGSIYEHDDFACLRGTGGGCELLISYTGFTERDWFEWELWVEDSTGLSSNHLELLVTITSGGPIVGRRTEPRAEGVMVTTLGP